MYVMMTVKMFNSKTLQLYQDDNSDIRFKNRFIRSRIHLVKTLIIGLDSDTPQDVLDVFGGWVGVATQYSQQVSGHVTHSRREVTLVYN